MFRLLRGIEIVLPLTAFQLLPPVHVAQVMNWIRDDGDVDVADFCGFEGILDGGRNAKEIGGADIPVESGSGEIGHVFRRKDMDVKIDNHRSGLFLDEVSSSV